MLRITKNYYRYCLVGIFQVFHETLNFKVENAPNPKTKQKQVQILIEITVFFVIKLITPTHVRILKISAPKTKCLKFTSIPLC